MQKCEVFSAQDIDSFRRAGKILAECLEIAAEAVRPGISTKELDKIAEDFIRSHDKAVPAFQGYRNYPYTLCTSINEECVHGLPSDRTLEEGDIIKLDGGVKIDGLYTDACVTVGVGRISPEAKKLLTVTQKALDLAIETIHEGSRVGDISSVIEKTVRAEGFAPVRVLTGHGLGRTLHQYPDVPNIGEKGTGAVLPAGTVIAIEPIVSAGSDEVVDMGDGWTLSIKDRKLAAHFEHTVLVTETGAEVLA